MRCPALPCPGRRRPIGHQIALKRSCRSRPSHLSEWWYWQAPRRAGEDSAPHLGTGVSHRANPWKASGTDEKLSGSPYYPTSLPRVPSLGFLLSHLCSQGVKPPEPERPQFPRASPAEFTVWKQASRAGLEPERAKSRPGGHTQWAPGTARFNAPTAVSCPSCIFFFFPSCILMQAHPSSLATAAFLHQALLHSQWKAELTRGDGSPGSALTVSPAPQSCWHCCSSVGHAPSQQ